MGKRGSRGGPGGRTSDLRFTGSEFEFYMLGTTGPPHSGCGQATQAYTSVPLLPSSIL